MPVRPLMGRGSQCREICERVDSPAFRLIYDAGCSLAVNEDPIDTLRTMAPTSITYMSRTRGGSVRASRRNVFKPPITGERFASTPLSEGLVDIPQVIGELDKIGYSGPLLLEYQGEDPLNVLPADVAFLRGLREQSAREDAKGRAPATAAR